MKYPAEKQVFFQLPTGHHTRWFCERWAKVKEIYDLPFVICNFLKHEVVKYMAMSILYSCHIIVNQTIVLLLNFCGVHPELVSGSHSCTFGNTMQPIANNVQQTYHHYTY